jgi:hypothetical protein
MNENVVTRGEWTTLAVCFAVGFVGIPALPIALIVLHRRANREHRRKLLRTVGWFWVAVSAMAAMSSLGWLVAAVQFLSVGARESELHSWASSGVAGSLAWGLGTACVAAGVAFVAFTALRTPTWETSATPAAEVSP